MISHRGCGSCLTKCGGWSARKKGKSDRGKAGGQLSRFMRALGSDSESD